jgi:hypothetical protein
MYASPSRRGIWTTMYIVEEVGELGNSKGVMIWLRLSCNVLSEVKGKPHSAKLPKWKDCAVSKMTEKKEAQSQET